MVLQTVLVVCNGNIHRSVIAEICINQKLKKSGLENSIQCISRGLQGTSGTPLPVGKNLKDYPKEWSLTKPILDRLGIEILESQQSTPVDQCTISRAGLILAMDRGVLLDRDNSLVRQFPEHAFRMRLFRELEGVADNVPDCFGSDDPDLYELVICSIHRIAVEGLSTLINLVQLFSSCKDPEE